MDPGQQRMEHHVLKVRLLRIIIIVNIKACFTACMAGTYLSMTYGECRNCPENSVGVAPGLVVCPCVEGYYRTPGEEDLSCTRELLSESTIVLSK